MKILLQAMIAISASMLIWMFGIIVGIDIQKRVDENIEVEQTEYIYHYEAVAWIGNDSTLEGYNVRTKGNFSNEVKLDDDFHKQIDFEGNKHFTIDINYIGEK